MKFRKCPQCRGKGQVSADHIDAKSLTLKQFYFLETYWRMKSELGKSPTYDELAAELGIKSLGSINKYVNYLRAARVIVIEKRGSGDTFSRLTPAGKRLLNS